MSKEGERERERSKEEPGGMKKNWREVLENIPTALFKCTYTRQSKTTQKNPIPEKRKK